MGQFWEGCFSDYDQERHARVDDCCQFIGPVADPTVVGDRHPAALSDFREPILVRALGRKMVTVTLDGEAGGSKNIWKAFAEVAIGKEDHGQAARS